MIPLQRGAAQSKLGGGPEDVFGFLYWMMNHPSQPRPKQKIFLKKRTKRLLRMLQALDAARALQLARASEGIFMSA